MTDKVKDIYGKIDALLVKRDSDILGERCTDNDDFPRLTEVIEGNVGVVWHGSDRRISGKASDGINSVDRRNVIRRKSQVGESVINHSDDYSNALLAMIEQRFSDVFSRHHHQLQSELLKIIREELSASREEKK
jgi:hypothetical protein